MATDPGDLVLDPTCGSGTTATVAEQWGRRWIMIDTSRVALALARARIMGARYPFYLLADSREGQQKEAEVTQTAPSTQPGRGNIRHGFVYERVPHITLKSIANNVEIDVIWDKWQETLEPLRQALNEAMGTDWQEWEVPRELLETHAKARSRGVETDRPLRAFATSRELHQRWWAARIARQTEIDRSIAAPAPFANPPRPSPPLFPKITDAELLGYGVPVEWLAEVHATTEDTLLPLADSLPAEAAEALLELATGGKPRPAVPATETGDPFDHPDALRRFRTLANMDELQQALDAPWDKWTIFLHPEQRQWVERDYHGPARVAGSAGTRKTIVALHRAAIWPRRTRTRGCCGPRFQIRSPTRSKSLIGPAKIIAPAELRGCLESAMRSVKDHGFALPFLGAEWSQVVDAWQLTSWESYRDVARLGRKTRLAEAQRRVVWSILEATQTQIAAQGCMTMDALFTRLAESLPDSKHPPCFARSSAQLARASAAAEAAGIAAEILDEHLQTAHGQLSVGPMHLAKGLEFRAVAVMACDDEVIPLQERISTVGDESDLQETYITEHQLLYVACTRARDHLLVTGTEPASEFLEDLVSN